MSTFSGLTLPGVYKVFVRAMFLVTIVGANTKSCVQDCKDLSDETMPRDTIVVDVTQYGVQGDSVSDNSASLIAMVNELSAFPERYYVLQFPPGRYLYTDNTWPTGLLYFTIEGNGAQFQNVIGVVPQGEDCMTIHVRGPHRRDNPERRYDYFSGSRFNQVSPDRIQLLETGAVYRCGDLVLLSGYEQQQEGYPPNPRYFEYRRITRMDSQMVFMEFDKPLNHKYDAQWGDYSWGSEGHELKSGAPRILNLSLADFPYPRHVELHDLTFLGNPNCTISDAVVIAGETVIFRNVNLEILYPAYHRVFRFIGGSVRRLVEFDKIVDTIYFENVHILRRDDEPNSSVAQAATGVNYLHLKHCLIEGPLRVSPRNLVVDGCRFIFEQRDAGRAVVERYNDFFPINSISVNDVTVEAPAEMDFHLIGYDNINEVEFASSVDPRSCIPIPDDQQHRLQVLRSIDIGTKVRNPKYGMYGTIQKIRRQADGNWCVYVQWDKNPPGNVQRLQWSQIKSIKVMHHDTFPPVFSKQREMRDSILLQFQKVSVLEQDG